MLDLCGNLVCAGLLMRCERVGWFSAWCKWRMMNAIEGGRASIALHQVSMFCRCKTKSHINTNSPGGDWCRNIIRAESDRQSIIIVYMYTEKCEFIAHSFSDRVCDDNVYKTFKMSPFANDVQPNISSTVVKISRSIYKSFGHQIRVGFRMPSSHNL